MRESIQSSWIVIIIFTDFKDRFHMCNLFFNKNFLNTVCISLMVSEMVWIAPILS